MITAGVISAISDVTAQKLSGIKKLQIRRLLLKVVYFLLSFTILNAVYVMLIVDSVTAEFELWEKYLISSFKLEFLLKIKFFFILEFGKKLWSCVRVYNVLIKI